MYKIVWIIIWSFPKFFFVFSRASTSLFSVNFLDCGVVITLPQLRSHHISTVLMAATVKDVYIWKWLYSHHADMGKRQAVETVNVHFVLSGTSVFYNENII